MHRRRPPEKNCVPASDPRNAMLGLTRQEGEPWRPRRVARYSGADMTFIETVPEDAAPAYVEALYNADREDMGFVRNLTRAFSLAPEVLVAWQGLNGAIKARMDLRRYELATVAAARRIRSSYCMLAHGSVLVEEYLESEALQAIVADHRDAGLEPVDIAVMDLADKVAGDATSVTEADIDRLRSFGLSDSEILDVVTAAAARCFFSKALDGLGVQPDARYAADLDADLRSALTVGRPIAAE
jgi:uncharacterized peroxidase-related enzyme